MDKAGIDPKVKGKMIIFQIKDLRSLCKKSICLCRNWIS